MPRRRTSNRPLKRRISLETQIDVQQEMGRRYKAVQHGELARHDATKDIFMLDKIRSGLPAKGEAGRGGGKTIINILPVAAGTYVSPEACQHLRATGRLPPGALITLIEPTDPLDATPQLSPPEPNDNVVALRRSDSPD